MANFQNWDVGVEWEDAKLAIQYFADIESVAMVEKRKWQLGMAMFCKPLTTASIRHFNHINTAEARKWLKQP